MPGMLAAALNSLSIASAPVHHFKMLRRSGNKTGLAYPQHGERECARRRAQMLKAHGKSPVVRFYGQLSGGESV